MFSGNIPFHNLRDGAVMKALLMNFSRPERPGVEMPDEVWQLVETCWAQDPNERPTASTICSFLEEFRCEDGGDQLFDPLSRLNLNQRNGFEVRDLPIHFIEH